MQKINKVEVFNTISEYEAWILNNRNAELMKVISVTNMQGKLIVTCEDTISKWSTKQHKWGK